MPDRLLPFLLLLFTLFMALGILFPNAGLAGFCEAEKDPFPDPSGESISDGSECPPGSPPGSSPLVAAKEPKETSPSPAPDPFPDPAAVDNGTPPPLSAGGAGEGAGDPWDDSQTGDGSGR